MLDHPGFWAAVAGRDGQIAGSAFAGLRSAIAGIGPVSAVPAGEGNGSGPPADAGRDPARPGGPRPGVRLVRTAYRYRPLALYAKLGF